MHSLTIEPIGETVDVADGQSILDACLRAGVWLPHACCHGLCGTCKVEILDGEVDHRDASSFALMDFERDEGKTLACCGTLASDATIEAEIDEDPDAQYFSVRDHSAAVIAYEDVTPDVRVIRLRVDGDGVAFQPGQYINLEVPGTDKPRAFSMAQSPGEQNRIELHIRRVEGGQATGWLHSHIQLGQKLSFSGPYGRFFVRKSKEKPLLFLAGGSGLSSPKSMILDLLEQGCTQPITLIHGVRGRKDLYCGALFERLAREHDNLRYVAALSAPDPSDDWSGETGFVHDVAARLFDGKFAGSVAYLCGPPPMIEACIRTLMKGRLFERDIFTEKFVTLGDGDAALARSPLFKRI